MDIAAHLPTRITDYGAPAATRRVAQAPAAEATRGRPREAVEYVVQGEVLEKRRAQAYDDGLLSAMRDMAREFRLHADTESPARGKAYAWGAVAAYRHTAVSTAPGAQREAVQAVDYFV